jgi:small subunit ribosomal protein S20
MPSHLSPTKRLRRDAKARLRNKSCLSKIRTLVKKARADLETPVPASEGWAESIQMAQSALASAASKGILHKKTASRRISRLMKKAHIPAAA